MRPQNRTRERGVAAVRKHAVTRPYPPDYCDAETVGYRLGLAAETIHDWARRGLLPKPRDIGTQRRWRWADIETWIAAQNGELPDGLDTSSPQHLPSRDDPFSRGVLNAKAQNA